MSLLKAVFAVMCGHSVLANAHQLTIKDQVRLAAQKIVSGRNSFSAILRRTLEYTEFRITSSRLAPAIQISIVLPSRARGQAGLLVYFNACDERVYILPGLRAFHERSECRVRECGPHCRTLSHYC